MEAFGGVCGAVERLLCLLPQSFPSPLHFGDSFEVHVMEHHGMLLEVLEVFMLPEELAFHLDRWHTAWCGGALAVMRLSLR